MDEGRSTIEFAMRLANAAPLKWTPSELQVWCAGLDAALGRDSKQIRSSRAQVLIDEHHRHFAPAGWGDIDFEALRPKVSNVLRSARGQSSRRLWSVPIGRLEFVALPYKGRSVLKVGGAPADVFLFVLLQALTLVQNDVIRECPQCRRLMWADGKRKFCSLGCKNKSGMARYIARHGRVRVRLARRQSYERGITGGKPRPYRPRS